MSTSPSESAPPPDPAARLTRLEEHAAFAEHTVEQLGDEVRLLNGRVSELARRLAQIESRLGAVADRLDKQPPSTEGLLEAE